MGQFVLNNVNYILAPLTFELMLWASTKVMRMAGTPIQNLGRVGRNLFRGTCRSHNVCW